MLDLTFMFNREPFPVVGGRHVKGKAMSANQTAPLADLRASDRVRPKSSGPTRDQINAKKKEAALANVLSAVLADRERSTEEVAYHAGRSKTATQVALIQLLEQGKVHRRRGYSKNKATKNYWKRSTGL